MAKLSGFKDNTWINGIGSLFKRINGSKWGVNLSIYPSKIKGNDSVLLSQAPILVRKNVINHTWPFRRQGIEIEFTITDLQGWMVSNLEECQAREHDLPKEHKSLCFVTKLANGLTIYLPQFELARALFFHNAYFSRASLEHGILQNEFSIENDDYNKSKATVTVLANSTCPVNVFSDPGYRRYLAWLLLDDDARLSYESISKNELMSGVDKGAYRVWHFEFEPPPLKGASLKVRGNLNEVTNTLFVYEIIEMVNIPADIPAEVEFFSPKFYVPEITGGKMGGSGGGQPAKHEIDEGQDSSGENDPIQLESFKTKTEFTKAVSTRKTATKSKKVGSGGEPGGEESPGLLSTEEQSPLGELPGAEWDGLDEQTDDMHLYVKKFASFSKMLDDLVSKHKCRVDRLAFRKLPSVGRCKMHLMRDDSTPRCWMLVRVTIKGKSFYLMEVDTSDAAKALSTKVVLVTEVEELIEKLADIEVRLLKKSLSWPKKYFDTEFGEGRHFFIIHQASEKKGLISQDTIGRWAENVYRNLDNSLTSK